MQEKFEIFEASRVKVRSAVVEVAWDKMNGKASTLRVQCESTTDFSFWYQCLRRQTVDPASRDL